MRKTTATLLGIATAAAGLAAGYPVFARRKCLTWGATAEEAAGGMPGDGILPTPTITTTRAVEIAAEPEKVWPWLVQMGPGRGGAYTYDRIENLLGLNMHSADTILPQFQDLTIGDVLELGRGPGMRVAILDRPRALVFESEDHHWVWAFGIHPTDHGCRLVSRNRIATPGAPITQRAFDMLIMEPGSLVMERKMLLSIKQRAEHLQTATPAATIAPTTPTPSRTLSATSTHASE